MGIKTRLKKIVYDFLLKEEFILRKLGMGELALENTTSEEEERLHTKKKFKPLIKLLKENNFKRVIALIKSDNLNKTFNEWPDKDKVELLWSNSGRDSIIMPSCIRDNGTILGIRWNHNITRRYQTPMFYNYQDGLFPYMKPKLIVKNNALGEGFSNLEKVTEDHGTKFPKERLKNFKVRMVKKESNVPDKTTTFIVLDFLDSKYLAISLEEYGITINNENSCLIFNKHREETDYFPVIGQGNIDSRNNIISINFIDSEFFIYNILFFIHDLPITKFCYNIDEAINNPVIPFTDINIALNRYPYSGCAEMYRELHGQIDEKFIEHVLECYDKRIYISKRGVVFAQVYAENRNILGVLDLNSSWTWVYYNLDELYGNEYISDKFKPASHPHTVAPCSQLLFFEDEEGRVSVYDNLCEDIGLLFG